MFVRAKKSGEYQYLLIVENQRIDGKVRQQVVATLGRLDILQATGKIDAILSSCARFAQKVSVLDAHKSGSLVFAQTIRIGPPNVFGRLWERLLPMFSTRDTRQLGQFCHSLDQADYPVTEITA